LHGNKAAFLFSILTFYVSIFGNCVYLLKPFQTLELCLLHCSAVTVTSAGAFPLSPGMPVDDSGGSTGQGVQPVWIQLHNSSITDSQTSIVWKGLLEIVSQTICSK